MTLHIDFSQVQNHQSRRNNKTITTRRHLVDSVGEVGEVTEGVVVTGEAHHPAHKMKMSKDVIEMKRIIMADGCVVVIKIVGGDRNSK